MRHFAGLMTLVLALFALALPVQAADTRSGKNFDHMRTLFPLTGAHAQIECQDCHVRGVFKGTPTQCQLCHIQGGRISATAKPATHVPTNDRCDLCHTSTVSWAGARFTHTGVNPGDCMRCHNGRTATGKSASHVQTTASCDSCHRMTAWLPAGFNHAGVNPGGCLFCHNGTNATGKPGNHVQTTASCDTCHRTTAWLPASFNHANVMAGGCLQCHANDKGANHIPTTSSCDLCHSTTGRWLDGRFSHTTVTQGSCMQCHGTITNITGKPPGHFVTGRSCDSCHTTTAWTPIRYTHTSPAYAIHNSGVSCGGSGGCHTTNTETISWRFGAYIGTCAGCHADKYKPDDHNNRTITDNRNCGTCHRATSGWGN